MTECKCGELQRIDVGADEYAYGHLRELVKDGKRWETLYGCPEAGRLWRRYYPHPEYHASGWPELLQISPEEAAATFGWAPAPDERLATIRAAPDSGKAYIARVLRILKTEGEEINGHDDRLWRTLRARGIRITDEDIDTWLDWLSRLNVEQCNNDDGRNSTIRVAH